MGHNSIYSTIVRGLGRDVAHIVLLSAVICVCAYILYDKYTANDRGTLVESERPISDVGERRLDLMHSVSLGAG